MWHRSSAYPSRQPSRGYFVHEWNFETKYVIQEGAAKDLSFRLRHAVWRANDAYNADYSADLNDTRLIVEYPLDVL